MSWALSLLWDMDISVAAGLYPIPVFSSSILNREAQLLIRWGLIGPCQLEAHKPCSVGSALEVRS